MTVTKTTTETSSPRMLIEGKKGELETLNHVLENARLFLMRKRGGEMEINGDGALLISTTSSKPSLGEDDARGTLTTTTAKKTWRWRHN